MKRTNLTISALGWGTESGSRKDKTFMIKKIDNDKKKIVLKRDKKDVIIK